MKEQSLHMSKKDWTLVISLVFITCLIDQLTKQWAVGNVRGLNFYGPFGLVLHRNPGAMLGMFSNLPPLLRIVSLSTGGAFLIFVYTAIQHLLPRRSIYLRIGMSLLLGGILGNVLDRIMYGSVIDFLLLGTAKWSTPAFNVADAIQWVGYVMVVGSLIINGHEIWPSNDFRKQMWINPKYQSRYIFVLISIGLGFALISGVYCFTFLKVTIDDLVIGNPLKIEKRFLYPFLWTYAIIAMSFVLVLFLIGRQLSHRAAGPVFAFEKYLREMMNGKDRKFKVRAGDEFAHLEDTAKLASEKFAEMKKRITELENCLAEQKNKNKETLTAESKTDDTPQSPTELKLSKS